MYPLDRIKRNLVTKVVTVFIVAGCGLARVARSQVAPIVETLSTAERQMITSVDSHSSADLALLQELVNINSGTMHFAGVEAVKDKLIPHFKNLGFTVRWVPMESVTDRAGDLISEHPCPQGSGHCGKRLLLVGHLDTVFEPSSSFQKYSLVPGTEGQTATGPGVADMKGGIVIMIAALEALRDAGALDKTEIRVVLSGDEERVGAPIDSARGDLVEAAKKSDVALEFEPSVRLSIGANTAAGQDSVSLGRRSSTTWHIESKGLSGHSSQIFGDKLGYGAIYELTRILDAFRRELPEEGLTYNVGLILGGATAESNGDSTGGSATGKANVIAPLAKATGDLRTLNDDQTARAETRMRNIVDAHLPKTESKISFDEGYPAMASTPANRELFEKWNQASMALGFGPVQEASPMTRGAGDISFVARFLPGLVGVGILGEGYHAEGETAWLDSLAKQAKRNAVLMERLSNENSGH